MSKNAKELALSHPLVQEQIQKLQAELEMQRNLVEELRCTTLKVDRFLGFIQAEYLDETGRWKHIPLYKFGAWYRLGKELFTFVKLTLKECYDLEFQIPIPTKFQDLINRILKLIGIV